MAQWDLNFDISIVRIKAKLEKKEETCKENQILNAQNLLIFRRI